MTYKCTPPYPALCAVYDNDRDVFFALIIGKSLINGTSYYLDSNDGLWRYAEIVGNKDPMSFLVGKEMYDYLTLQPIEKDYL